MEIERQKLQWEKQKHQDKQNKVVDREKAEKWMSEGKSPAEIEILMRCIF
jgi:hypothetical protein